MKDRRACLPKALGNDSKWNEYFKIQKDFKQIIMDKRKVCRKKVMNNVHIIIKRILKISGCFLIRQLNLELRRELKL